MPFQSRNNTVYADPDVHRLTRRLQRSDKTRNVLLNQWRRYRTFSKNAPDVQFLFEYPSGRLITANPRFHDFFGPPRDLRKTRIWDLVSPGSHHVLKDLFHTHLHDEKPGKRKATILAMSPDGGTFWAEIHTRFERLAGKSLIFVWLYDITLRTQAEEELEKVKTAFEEKLERTNEDLVRINRRLNREIEERRSVQKALAISEKWYKTVFELSADPIVISRESGEIVDFNPATLNLLGYSEKELHKLRTNQTFKDASDLERVVLQIQNGEIVKDAEIRFRRKDGETVVCLLSGLGWETEQGELLRLDILHDITERKQMEEALILQRDLGVALSFTLQLEEAMEVVLTHCARIREIDCSAVYLAGGPDGGLELAAHSDFFEKRLAPVQQYGPRHPVSRMVLAGRSLSTTTPSADHIPFRMNEEDRKAVRALCIAPVLHEGTVVASLHLLSRTMDGISRISWNTIEAVAAQIGGVISRLKAVQALRRREMELNIKSDSLEKVNTALKVLLRQRDEDKGELEEKVLFNMRQLVEPFLAKLKKSGLSPQQQSYLSVLESNLTEIISPFSRTLSAQFIRLTPSEVQVANLVKQGKTSTEISGLLNISRRTVETHRDNIRRKIGIRNKKTNLRSYLSSLD